MSKQEGEYNLIREDIENEKLEYFDFDTMSFVNKVTRGLDLSSIDALTTMFTDGNELNNYISKIDNNEYNYIYKIIYTTNKSKEEKVLKVIWDDPILSSISKLADDKVDFVSDNNYYVFLTIIDDIKNNKNGLLKKILSSKKESYRLSDKNKKIIERLATDSKNEITFKDLVEVFSDFKEYRALYLNYKYYNLENNISIKDQVEKVKRLIKKD